MQHRVLAGLFALLLVPLSLLGQDVPITATGVKIVPIDQTITVKVDRNVAVKFPFVLETPPNLGFYDWLPSDGVKGIDAAEKYTVTSAPKGENLIRVRVRYGQYDEATKTIKYFEKYGNFSFIAGEIVPPTPTPPTPTPPEPKPPTPTPVKSFRVIFTYESADTLTSAQNSAMYGKVVRDYLKQSCTVENGTYGYRYWDHDETAEQESPTMKALWNAVKPKLTTLPAVAVEVNGSVDIIPLAATPAEMVAILKKYKGE